MVTHSQSDSFDVADLRPVRDSDSAGLIDLIGRCWAEHPGVLLAIDEEEPWLRAPAAYYQRGAEGARMWVLDGSDTALAACVGVKPIDQSSAELKSLYVDPDARRRGLGRALVALVETAALERGARTVRLWSDSRFADAHRLYERLGYQRDGSRELHDLSETTEFGYFKVL